MAEVEHHLHARCRPPHCPRSALSSLSHSIVSYLLVSHRRRESQQPSTRMGPLLLLTSMLLFCCGRVEPQSFIIREVVLIIEPNTEVARDTNVTVRCHASIAGSVDSLSRTYTIYRDGIQVYTKTTSSSEDLVYPLYQARVSDTGKYKCEIDIEGRRSTSDPKKLTVTGLSVPVLHINKGVFSEGEEVKATCTAPEERGSIIFYFYADSEEIREERVSSNKAEASLRLRSLGIRKLHCDYAVLVTPDSFKSKQSNNVTVSVKVLPITTVLEISPEENIYEGDMLSMSCTAIMGFEHRSTTVNYNLFLVQGNDVLDQTKMNQNGQAKINHTMTVQAKHSGDFECRLETGSIPKVSKKTVSVTELFSEPTLTMSPAEVFYDDKVNLTCKSQNYASERLRKEEVTYTIEPRESQMSAQREVGVFSGKAPRYSLNYTCTARARGFSKSSNTLLVTPKVTASMPTIWVSGNVILGEPFQILCLSDRGSLPIRYSLWRGYDELNRTMTVQQLGQPAVFPITIHQPEDITLYMCDARNNPRKEAVLSKRLRAPVIVPLSEPWLTVIPVLTNIAEGDRLYLICSVKGTPPVTFKWYRHGNPQVLFSSITKQNSSDYQVPGVGSQHSGNYYCEASNNANKVRSPTVTIEVLMAMWKKGVIVASCLLVVAVLVLLCVLRFRAKRGKKREAAAELSVKPSSPKSDDSLTVSLTHDREVYNAPTGRVDRAASVWSERPADEANDEESSAASTEPDVEYTEVVHPRPADPVKVPLKKGTDTVYSELQTSALGAVDHHDYQGAVEYAELNGDQPVNFQAHPDVDAHQHLPVPVD